MFAAGRSGGVLAVSHKRWSPPVNMFPARHLFAGKKSQYVEWMPGSLPACWSTCPMTREVPAHCDGARTFPAPRGIGSDLKQHRKHPAAPNLTLFEKLLVSLGLAEPPPAPTYQGNPATQVWIDVHTALYYCPGADFYGKTDGGKIISQREAQQDQFEPANREACD